MSQFPFRCCCIVLLIIASAAGEGCAKRQKDAELVSGPPGSAGSSGSVGSSSRSVGNAPDTSCDPLGLQTNGLQLRQWRVPDDSARIGAALLAHASGSAAPEEVRQRLSRNGLRLMRVPLSKLESLKSGLGGTTLNVESWHGQAYRWREIAARPIPSEGMLIGIDGRVQRFAAGRMRLMIRGWTIPMEDGPAVHFEMLPDIDRTQSTRFEQMLAQRTFRGERLTSMRLDLLLEPDFAYVMVAEAPGVRWEEPQSPDAWLDKAESPQSPDVHQSEREAAAGHSSLGFDSIGPRAVAPLTVGELLLPRRSAPAPRTRDVMIFIPRLPKAMLPIEQRAETGVLPGASGADAS